MFHHKIKSEKEIQKQLDETSTEDLLNDGFVILNKKEKIQNIANLNMKKEVENYKKEYDKDKNLKTLDFSNCNLKKIENILSRYDLKSLTTLTLDNNNIIEFSEDLPYIPSLERLWINNNNISNLDLFLIRISNSFPSLLYLSLIGNPCCKLDKEYRIKIISYLKNLIFLDMYPVKQEEREEIKIIFNQSSSSSSEDNSSNDGFESQDEEKELIKKIEKTKNEIKQQKDYIQELFEFKLLNERRKDIEQDSKKMIEFFNTHLNEFNFLKNQILLKEQIKISLEMLEMNENDNKMIEKILNILEELNEIFKDEMKEIEKQIEIIKRERERLQREEMERLERKRIMEENKRLEDIERERSKRLINRRKEKLKEEKEYEKKIENDLNFQILEEQELKEKNKMNEEIEEEERRKRLKSYLF